MCGITGFFGRDALPLEDTVVAMAETLSHRGPNDSGNWYDKVAGLALAHRRLSILDLSPAGHQPMTSVSGRYVIVFNGEIYNHLELRAQLQSEGKAPKWRGHSDTETLLASFENWGIKTTLQATVGMFAIALWDRERQELTLARDRVGEKPLYYGWQGNGVQEAFLFGSELKALKKHPACQSVINRDALALYLRHNCIPSPYSIYRGIRKLLPGHYLTLPLHSGSADKSSKPVPYWEYNRIAEEGMSRPLQMSPEEAVEALNKQLTKSISGQMLADVPLGAFLSGGVDSSAVVAIMQAQSSKPVRTFTIGFDEGGYNEAADANAVAQHLGTDHTEIYVRPEDALDVIPKLPQMYCEPFSDSSQIPTFLVSHMARQHVTVALSGDGGDELFGGYNRYIAAQKVWGPVQRLPRFARLATAGCLRTLPPAIWDRLFDWARPALPKRLQLSIPGEKARKLADVLSLSDGRAFYRQLTSHWTDPANIVVGATEPQTLITDPAAWLNTDSLEHAMMAMDAQTYMADDILTKVDRAAMAASLETRVPMLDHRVIELAWKMPLDYKIRNGQGKWPLRQVLYRYVPKELIERPKMGFGIPLDSWLRGPLREWAEALIDEERLRREGYFHPAPIRNMWEEHLSGRKNWQYHLWSVLMFQAWLEKNHT